MSIDINDRTAAAKAILTFLSGGLHAAGIVLVDENHVPIPFTPQVNHGAADAGAPLPIGGHSVATLTDQTLVDDDDRTRAMFDLSGRIITRPDAPLGDYVNSGKITCTSGASTQALASAGAGLTWRPYAMFIHDAAGAGGYVRLLDGSGGTEKAWIPYGSIGGGFDIPFIPGFSPATALYVDPSVSTDVTVFLFAYKTKD